MYDRETTKPGRVLITPEDGSPSFYATVVMADEPIREGDAPTKKNLLKDATAEMLGLPDSATVNDAIYEASKGVRWHVLADVTLAESDVQGAVIPLARDFTEHSSIVTAMFTATGGPTLNVRLHAGVDTSGVRIGAWTIGYQKDTFFDILAYIVDIGGKGKFISPQVSLDGANTSSVYLYAENGAFPLGTRFILFGR